MNIFYDQYLYSLYRQIYNKFPVWDHYRKTSDNSLVFEFHTQHYIQIWYNKEYKNYICKMYFKHNPQWLEFKKEYNCCFEKEVLTFIEIYVKPVNDWAKLEMIKERKECHKQITQIYKNKNNFKFSTKRKRECEKKLTDLRRMSAFLKKEINKLK